MDKREQILNIATELFSENGFEKTPISAICEGANVSKGLVFHHFKNKDILLREIFVRTTEIIGELNREQARISDPRQRLAALIESIFASMIEHRKLYQFNLNVLLQPTTRAILSDLIEERATMLLETTEDIFSQLSKDNSRVLSHLFIAEIDGTAMNYLFSYDAFPLMLIKDELIKKYS
ncbi:TetR/AcrR family transcriptional regulator [Aliamphritea ceti]|uniref:TetR/AcrR family transcriptional regulator n=1 Tax=Aliamphritea ceti TaxID=1524258 RepID=UPI0021C430B7|nr:TetR/AcrR family transcriptional regulator [Aliamphritea ceti]